MTNLVIMKNQQAVTSSLQVAETFGKEHKVVLKAIDELKRGGTKLCRPILRRYLHSSTKQTILSPSYYESRRLHFVSNGVHWSKALQFKLKYIEAFNQMEKKFNSLNFQPLKENWQCLLYQQMKKQMSV